MGDDTDWLVRSFHPYSKDVIWLRQRFGIFCIRKMHVDFEAQTKIILSAPLHQKIIHKLFGRHNPLSSILLHGDKQCFETYMENTLGKHMDRENWPVSCEKMSERAVLAYVLTGPLLDAKKLIEALHVSDDLLYRDVLTIFELVHMTYFCHKDYVRNARKEGRWIVPYFRQLTENISHHKTDFDFCLSSNGLINQTLLTTVSAMMMGVVRGRERERTVHVDSEERKCPSALTRGEISPIACSPMAMFNQMRGRTLMGKNSPHISHR